MSNTHHLVCHETKQMVWIGQGNGSMEAFYSEENFSMDALGRFLVATAGRPLQLVEINAGADPIPCDDYEEFKWK